MAKMKMSSVPSARSALLASVALLVLVSSAEAFDSNALAGQGYTIAVPEPVAGADVEGWAAIVANYGRRD